MMATSRHRPNRRRGPQQPFGCSPCGTDCVERRSQQKNPAQGRAGSSARIRRQQSASSVEKRTPTWYRRRFRGASHMAS